MKHYRKYSCFPSYIFSLCVVLLCGHLLSACTEFKEGSTFPKLPNGSYLGILEWKNVSQALYLLVEGDRHRLVFAKEEGKNLSEEPAIFRRHRLRITVADQAAFELEAGKVTSYDANKLPIAWKGKISRGSEILGAWTLLSVPGFSPHLPSASFQARLKNFEVERKTAEKTFSTWEEIQPVLARQLDILQSRKQTLYERSQDLRGKLSTVSSQLDIAREVTTLGRVVTLETSIAEREKKWLQDRMRSSTPALFVYSPEEIDRAKEIHRLRTAIAREQAMMPVAVPEEYGEDFP